ncbi:hypothetical protein B0T16DRAFT_417801 [Cercophora newfieldiana]|uniref:Plus3 domain-containing protein n=1 Tax=Cercophora newfieldiana TaxID=92897 RepID=A0AA40CMK5_9PEZI|nr:hypothetical protein B0T16DRAFT_417801 [Cercophora newfieldiana]
MSDIDDELLALAGGDVSSDEDEEMDMSRDGSRSPSPAPVKKKEAQAKGGAAKKPAAKPAKKRARDDGSEDEGEASSVPSSPASQQSVPMDESDSDSDAPQTKPRGGDDDMNQYPVDGLFRDYDEKEQIMGMREIEREQILAERREENERTRQNRMLRQLKVNQEKDIKKRKASAADLEDGQRKASRVRTKAGETSEKMDTLRRAREERSSRKEQRERENDRRKAQSPSYRRSPGRDEGDSDVEWMGPSKSKQKSRSPDARESLPVDLRDVERIRLGRSRFAEVCFYPGFEEAITGCYVRINIGPDPEKGEPVYRMAVIKGFKQGRPYAIPDQTGNQMVVDLYADAAHGKAQRDWPFISCSDSGFTEAEWERYKKVCAAEGVTIPDKMKFINKIDDINRLVRRKWTDEELSEKTKRQAELYSRFSGVEREAVTKQLERARARGDEELVNKLQDKLDHLEVPRLAFKTSLNTPNKSEKKGPTQQDRLAIINAENRRKNTEAVRKAQLKERAHIREIQMRIARGEDVQDDSSRRVRTRMKFVHDANDNDDSPATPGGAKTAAGSGISTPANGTSTPKTDSLLPHIVKLQELQRSQSKSGIPTIHKPLVDDDIIGALDLDIDIDID